MEVKNIEKKGQKIFVTTEKEKPYIIDMENNVIISPAGRKLKNNPFLHCDYDYTNNNTTTRLIFYIRYGSVTARVDANYNYWHRLKINEKFLPYLDLIDTDYYSELPTEIPEGYIPFLRKNDDYITTSSLRKFKYEKAISVYSNADQKRLRNIDFCGWHVEQWIKENIDNKPLITSILKVFANSYKIFETPVDAIRLLRLIDKLGADLLNTEATIQENYSTYKAIVDKERNEKIIKNQMKIKELETIFDNPKYAIIVPTTMEAFTEEGSQQHNCVGSFYHDNIAKGVDLIYFLREKENINKSFETCRFSLIFHCTAEHRAKHNENASAETRDIVENEIDKLIMKLLKK